MGVPRRIEIELTSARPDGSWTWRAAGAREPKGTLDGSLLYAEAKPGDVLRAEAEFELEGISIVSVAAPKVDERRQPQRIEVVGPARQEAPGVTTQLAGRSDRRLGDRRHEREDGRPGRRDRDGARPPGGRGRDDARDGERRRHDGVEAETSKRHRGGGDESEKPRRERQQRPESTGSTERTRGPDRAAQGERDAHTVERPGPGRGRRPEGRPPAERRRTGGEGERQKARRFNPGNVHRKAVMESLPPEQQPIAEQVLRGGIPAVRTAIHLEREKATAEGRAAPNADELIAMAEALLPRLKTAEWRDRAEAAAADADGISLRDLRSVVAGADVARDDATRALSANLREALARRVAKLQKDWTDEVAKHLDSGHVVRALRLSARPPESSARLDTEVSNRLTDAAGEAMSPDAAVDLWAALLDAAAASPVRRAIKPAGLPDNAPPDLKRAAHQQSGSIPALAKLLGVSIPPPPQPMPSQARQHRGRPARPEQRAASGPPLASAQPADRSTSTEEPSAEHTETPGDTRSPTADSDGAGPATSAEGGQDPAVVEELGEAVDKTQPGDLG
jgi:hypothetical protein